MKAEKNPQIRKITKYLLQARKFYPSDREKFLNFTEKVNNLLKDVNYPKGKADYYMLVGRTMRDTGNTKTAEKNFLRAKNIYTKIGDKVGIADVYFNLSMNNVMQGNHEKALEASNNAVKMYEKLGQTKELCLTVINMAYIYKRLGDPATGLSIILDVIDKYNLQDNAFLKQIAYVSISDMYIEMEMNEEAFKYLNECRNLKSEQFTEYHRNKFNIKIANALLQRKEYKKALAIYHKILNYDKKTGFKLAMANTYNDIGIVYDGMKNYSHALKYFLHAYKISSGIKDDYNLANIILNIAHIYSHEGKNDEAIEKLNEALKLTKNTGAQAQTAKCYLMLYELYKRKKDIPKAFVYLEKHIEIQEKKYVEETKQLSDNLQKVYMFKLSAREAEILKDKNEKLNEALQKVEAQNKELDVLNKEKSEILRIVAHDIKNPSNNITGLANVLIEEGKSIDTDEYNELLENIVNCSSQIEGIITNILKSSLLEDAKLTPVLKKINITKLIQDTIELNRNKAEQKSIKILFKENKPVYLKTDKTFFQQITDNLISNAIKFSEAGKLITVQIKNNGTSFILKVKDEGPGILPQEMNMLFDKYSRLSSKPTHGESSTGLGLSIVKKLVNILGGEIWCESKYGQGSEFIVRLNH
ncbi:MAG TPA: tetratricopeptide repeat-containing sensor histidine kinase [Ignavibacteria bacterium]|nr:tetratricopeptide repeat-containing sensor histidine kinase [Ignavibacteria bacterium]